MALTAIDLVFQDLSILFAGLEIQLDVLMRTDNLLTVLPYSCKSDSCRKTLDENFRLEFKKTFVTFTTKIETYSGFTERPMLGNPFQIRYESNVQ